MTAMSANWLYRRINGLLSVDIGRLFELMLQRRRFKRLLDLDDRLLDDIGVTREEVAFACRLPLHMNAAMALRYVSQQRRRHERHPTRTTTS